MSTAAIHPSTLSQVPPRPWRPVALKAEWTKFRTLRSTWLTLAISVLAAIALGAVATASDVRSWDDMSQAQRASYDPTSTSLVGILFGALVLGAVGVRAITVEYATGMIRTTAAAIPRRRRIIVAKVGIVAVAAFLVTVTGNVAAFTLGQRILSSESIDVPFGADSVGPILAGAVAVAAFAVIGVGLGAIIRRAAVANIIMALVVIGGQLFGAAMPSASQRFLPFSALQATVTVQRSDELLTPWTAVAMLVIYASVAVSVALHLIRRRDV
jgi:ABC-type transport system involved in multi-copper enzyme maturation permease subunit